MHSIGGGSVLCSLIGRGVDGSSWTLVRLEPCRFSCMSIICCRRRTLFRLFVGVGDDNGGLGLLYRGGVLGVLGGFCRGVDCGVCGSVDVLDMVCVLALCRDDMVDSVSVFMVVCVSHTSWHRVFHMRQ